MAARFILVGPNFGSELDVQSYKEQAERDIRSQLVALGVNPDSVDYDGFIDQYYLNGFRRVKTVSCLLKHWSLSLVLALVSALTTETNYVESALNNGVRYDDAWFQN